MDEKLIYGTWEFSGDEIKSGNLFRACSLLSVQLEADTLTAEVKCADPAILQAGENAKMIYFHNGQPAGTFYAQSIERTGPELYKVSGISGMGLLSKMPHPGGIYTGQTAETVIRGIMGNLSFTIKESLRTVKLYGWLPYAKPPEKSARDNLVQVLFALGASVKTDFDGVLRIVSLWGGMAGRVEKRRMYQGGSVEYEKSPAASVSVTEHQYMVGGEETKLFEGDAVSGDIITFSEPMYGLSAAGFRILESGANYAKLSTGNGTLTGRKYIHTTRQVTESLRAGAENVKTVSDGTLVSLVNSRAVAQRMADYYRCTERIRNPIVSGTERPGDVVSIYHPYKRAYVSACIESADVNISKKVLKAGVTALVGYAPKQIEQTVTYDQHQVITSSRTVTLPDGVTSVRAVLIGGGSGGKGGKKGNNGTAGSGCSSSGGNKPNGGLGAAGGPGKAGEGGAGSAGGSGGKIASFEITGDAIKTLTISIGGGGSGGAANEGTGSAGGNTTLTVNGTTYTSANGTTSASGYQDLVTGTVYGRSGTAGKAGAKGGDGGDYSYVTQSGQSSGYSGESVGNNRGGKGGSNSLSSGGGGNSWLRNRCGGGGGGAAYNAPGADGTLAGGTGAAGTKPAAATVPGSGGTGGNGGGGGGGGGGTSVFANYGYSVSATGGAAGVGGDGGPGGNGAPGCVILYYGVPQKMKAGSPVDRKNRFFLDKFGRLLVV